MASRSVSPSNAATEPLQNLSERVDDGVHVHAGEGSGESTPTDPSITALLNNTGEGDESLQITEQGFQVSGVSTTTAAVGGSSAAGGPLAAAGSTSNAPQVQEWDVVDQVDPSFIGGVEPGQRFT